MKAVAQEQNRRNHQKKNTGENSSRRNEAAANKQEVRCYNCGVFGHCARDCDKRADGKKCFRCNRYGHEANKCSEARKNETGKIVCDEITKDVNNTVCNEVTHNVHTIVCNDINDNRMISGMNDAIDTIMLIEKESAFKEVTIDDRKINALIDTGGPICVIREDIYRTISDEPFNDRTQIFCGFGRGVSKTLGTVDKKIGVDGKFYMLTLHIVPIETTDLSVIIGRDILKKASLLFDHNGVIVFERFDPIILSIQTDVSESLQIDIGSEVSSQIRKGVTNALLAYKPEKTKTTNTMLRIRLKEEKVVCQRPRRLPVAERSVV